MQVSSDCDNYFSFCVKGNATFSFQLSVIRVVVAVSTEVLTIFSLTICVVRRWNWASPARRKPPYYFVESAFLLSDVWATLYEWLWVHCDKCSQGLYTIHYDTENDRARNRSDIDDKNSGSNPITSSRRFWLRSEQ